MREKIMKLASLIKSADQIVDDAVREHVTQTRDGWFQGYGEAMPTDAAQGLSIIEQKLLQDRDVLKVQVEEILMQRLQSEFTETEVDEVLAYSEKLVELQKNFNESSVGQRLAHISPTIDGEISDAKKKWLTSAFASIEPDLQRTLGFGEATPPQETSPTP